MNKPEITKGLYLWAVVGLMIYVLLAVFFIKFSGENYEEITPEAYEQLQINGGNYHFQGNAPKIFFRGTDLFETDYLNLYIKEVSREPLKAELYYAEEEMNFSKENFTELSLRRGFNEIKIKNSPFYRLDITGGEEVSVDIDGFALRSAPVPFHTIPFGCAVFVVFWFTVYAMGKAVGIKYTGLWRSFTLLTESGFVVFMSFILIYGTLYIKYRLPVYALVPAGVWAAILIYRTRYTKGCVKYGTMALFGIMAVILGFVGIKMLSNLTTDLGTVYYSAWEIAEKGAVNKVRTGNEPMSDLIRTSNNDYFVRYGNNIPLLMFFAAFYKILSLFGLSGDNIASVYISIGLNVLFIMLGVLFGVFTARQLFGRKGGMMYMLMAFLFVPYYINACRFYTDTISLPFVTLALWLYSIPDYRFKRGFVKYLLIGGAICVGTLIKGSLIILLIALVIQLILSSIKNIRLAAVAIAVFLVGNVCWGVFVKNNTMVDMSREKKLAVPVSHWVMMSLNRGYMGDYSHEDFEFTDSFPSKKSKQANNIKVIKRRLGEFDSLGDFADFQFKKAGLTWCDGQFMQDIHIDEGREKGEIYNWIQPNGSTYPIYKTYIQAYVFCLYILALAGGLLSIKKQRADYGMFLRLIMLGVMLFFMIWETKSRYILNFTPVFMLAAIYGIKEIIKKSGKKSKD